jgi:PAS domain S-box-containing protein
MSQLPSSAETERLGRAILGGSAEAIIYSDREGLIRLWSVGAERIFGFPKEEALGQSLDLIIPERLRERHWTGYHKVMRTGESRYAAGELLAVPGVRKDGSRISLEFTIEPVQGPDSAIEGLLAILRDVTSRFEEIRDLRKEVARLRNSPADGAAAK